MAFPELSITDRIDRLTPPAASAGPRRVLLDTDTYNEVDDQFAVVHALLSPDTIELEAITAAPFFNHRSASPAEGMEKSFEEIERLLSRLDIAERERVYRGSTSYLEDAQTPVDSDAARAIIERAHASDEPLYVCAIGAITNVASALLIDPDIVRRIVVVWLGGQPTHAPTAWEFNLKQDIPAAQVLFDCGVPLVQIPCRGVASHLLTTIPEMRHYVEPCGAIGEFLFETYETYRKDQFARSKEIWDIAATGWLIDPAWVPSTVVASPILTERATWSLDAGRQGVRIADRVDRDAIFGDLFTKLRAFADGRGQPSWR